MSYCKDCYREIDRAYEDMQAAEPWTKTGNMSVIEFIPAQKRTAALRE